MRIIFLRSLIFNVLFYALLVFWLLVALPTFLMPRHAILAIAKAWARSSIWLLRAVCGTKVEYRGLEKIPNGPLIVASKHQSMWETFALLQFFEQPLFILKRELMWIPFFGWYLKKSDMIGIDRDAGGRALLAMTRRAGEAQFRPVLAAPHLHALSRYAGGRVPRSAAARAWPPRIHRPRLQRDRGSHQPAGRDRAAGAGPIVRPSAVRRGENLTGCCSGARRDDRLSHLQGCRVWS
jgi:hypothetical protein